jgi:hypothetical protein
VDPRIPVLQHRYGRFPERGYFDSDRRRSIQTLLFSSTVGTAVQVTNSAVGTITVSGQLGVADISFTNLGAINVNGASAHLYTIDSGGSSVETFTSLGTFALQNDGWLQFSSTVVINGNNILSTAEATGK